jgi:hypothetical protein
MNPSRSIKKLYMDQAFNGKSLKLNMLYYK